MESIEVFCMSNVTKDVTLEKVSGILCSIGAASFFVDGKCDVPSGILDANMSDCYWDNIPPVYRHLVNIYQHIESYWFLKFCRIGKTIFQNFCDL